MSETLVNTIDGDKLYAERALKDASGNSISETYATKSEIPVVDQSYDATSTNPQSGMAVAEALSNVPSPLSAGNGIDIYNNVISAKADGSSITYNSDGELEAHNTLTGGSGIDIYNNVISAKADGSSITYNSDGELEAHNTLTGGNGIDIDTNNDTISVKTDGSTISFNASGELQATVSGGVTDVTVDGTSVVNAQGVAEITMPTFTQVQSDWSQSDNTQVDYIKNKPTINNVPSVGSTDDGKALVAHYSGGSGSYSWDSLPSGIFPVEYGVTTYAQITDAITAGKLPVLKYVSSLTNTQYIAVLVGNTVDTSYHFTCTHYSKSTSLEFIGIWAFTISVQGTWSTRTIDNNGFQADWNQTDSHFVNYIKNKPTLATVATTGAYSDLSGTPTLATVATSGDYDDLTNKPSIPAAQVNSDWNASSGVSEILNKPNLATVATTGAYSDLSGTPTIPAAQVNSDWTASSGVAEILNKPTLATVATSGSYNDLSDKPTIPTMELFEAVYGTTTYADITAAIAAKKIVYCRVSPSGATRMAFLAYIGSSNVEFQYYRSLSSRSATNQLDEVYVYKVDANGWTTTTRKAGVSIAAGTGLTSTYASGTLTINGKDTDQTYDATSANPQSGVAVAGALAGKEDAFTVGDGLEMVTSGNTRTLQVEAPVDIVAGPGIVIDNPDGNTMRVSQQYPSDETVLWSGSPGIYLNNDTAALSEAFTNFDRVAIYAVSVYGGPARRFEFDVSADNSQFRFMTNSLDGAAILNVAFNLNLTGTTATLSRSKLIMVQYSTNAITTSDLSAGSTYKSYITSIVGVHRIASN